MSTSFGILFIDYLAAAFLGTLIIELVLRVSYQRRWFDVPDERKIHELPVPRLGGVSFLPVIMITIAVTIGMMYHLGLTGVFAHDYYVLIQLSVLMGSGILMYIVGVADDLASVDFKMKFVFQFVASCIVVQAGLWIKDYCGLFGIHSVPGLVGMPLSVLLIISIMNSINFIDGIDGLASGICILALLTLSYIAFAEESFLHMIIGVTTLGVVSVFWLYNMFGKREKNTKVFMGDSGSLTLGLLLSFLIINVSGLGGADVKETGKYLAIGFSTFLIPMLDMFRVVVYRLAHRRSPFHPDSNHIHHLLMSCGLSQHGALVALLSVDILFICLTTLLVKWLDLTWVFVADVLLWGMMMLAVHFVIKHREKTSPSGPALETQDR